MGAGPITSENFRDAATDLVASRALELLVGNLQMVNLINRDYENEIKQKGETVSIKIPPVRTPQNVAEDPTLTFKNAEYGFANLTLTDHLVDAFRITDMGKIMAEAAGGSMKAIDDQMEPAILGIVEAIETKVFALYAQLTTTAGATNAAISEAYVDDADTKLFDNKVPKGLPRYLAMHSKPYSTLRNIARFSENQTIGNPLAITQGEIPTVKGFIPFRSQYAPKDGSNVYHSLAFTRDAFAIAFRDLPAPQNASGVLMSRQNFNGISLRVLGSFDHDILSDKWSVDVLFGTAVIRPGFAVDIQSNG